MLAVIIIVFHQMCIIYTASTQDQISIMYFTVKSDCGKGLRMPFQKLDQSLLSACHDAPDSLLLSLTRFVPISRQFHTISFFFYCSSRGTINFGLLELTLTSPLTICSVTVLCIETSVKIQKTFVITPMHVMYECPSLNGSMMTLSRVI